MEKGMLGVLVLSGLVHFSSSVLYLHHYYLINDPKPWGDAQQYCRENYVDLATVRNWSETRDLAGQMSTSIPLAFMGLYRTWGWSVSNVDNFKEGTLTYSNWGGSPGWQLFCGTISVTGQWFAADCSTGMTFFCYNASATNISERFTLVTVNKSWTDAQSYCRSVDTDLAKVQNQLENEQLWQMVNGGGSWIGLTGLFWLWSDGSTPFFIPWNPLEPLLSGSADCSAIHFDGTDVGMQDASCTYPLPFFCYSVPSKQYFVRLQLTSSADMTDPAVIESVLTQVEEKLRQQIGSQHVNLRSRRNK